MQDKSYGWPALEEMGPRIVVCGPICSGKSTLSLALAAKLNLTPIHLDELYLQPIKGHHAVPYAQFLRVHEDAIRADRWVVDGNHDGAVRSRLERATGLIYLHSRRPLALGRYVFRTFVTRRRFGFFEDIPETFQWDAVRWLMRGSLGSLKTIRTLLHDSGKPLVEVDVEGGGLTQLYSRWGLTRPEAKTRRRFRGG